MLSIFARIERMICWQLGKPCYWKATALAISAIKHRRHSPANAAQSNCPDTSRLIRQRTNAPPPRSAFKDEAGALGFRHFPGLPAAKENGTCSRRTRSHSTPFNINRTYEKDFHVNTDQRTAQNQQQGRCKDAAFSDREPD